MKTIRIKIEKKTGKITISTEGYQGAECLAATKKLEDGLGLNDPDRELTDEYHQTTDEQQTLGGT